MVDGFVGTVVPIASSNARALLGASFGAVVTVGAFSFWMRPIAAQLSAVALPPQLLASHLHDRFQARIIAVTVGVLGFLAVTLLAVPSDSGDPAPAASTIVGMVLTTGALAALLIAMHQAERSLQPHSVVAETAQDVIRRLREASVDEPLAHPHTPTAAPATIVATSSGWVTTIDTERLICDLPTGTILRLETHVGAFVVGDWTAVASVWPSDNVDDDLHARISTAVEVGDQRSGVVDLIGSVNHFVDIGVHAITTSNATPSTGQQALSWTGAILHELSRHDELDYPDLTTEEGRVVLHDGAPSVAQLAEHIVDRLRRAAAADRDTTIDLSHIVKEAEHAALHIGHHGVAQSLRRQLDIMDAMSDDAQVSSS
jgi:uncharacterized membrane protein